MKNKIHASRWSLPAMEHAKVNLLYAFSFNPESQPCSWASDKMNKWFTDMIKVLGHLKACTVEMSIEISKLGRLHFHGTLQISSLWKFYYYDVPFLCKEGSFEIDTIKSIDEWQAYVDKNKDEMSKMMREFSLPRTLATKTIKIQKTTPLKRIVQFEEDTESSTDSDGTTDEIISVEDA